MAGLGKTTHSLNLGRVDKSHGQSIRDFTSSINLIISAAAAAGLTLFPYDEDSDGNRIPTIVFKGQASRFHAFVLFIMFGFTASLSALLSYDRPKVARVFRRCSVICLSCATAVLLYAACASLAADR